MLLCLRIVPATKAKEVSSNIQLNLYKKTTLGHFLLQSTHASEFGFTLEEKNSISCSIQNKWKLTDFKQLP